MNKYTALAIIFFFAVILASKVCIYIARHTNRVTSDINQTCVIVARDYTNAYAQTEFARLDFYDSCIDNILYTSPLFR